MATSNVAVMFCGKLL